MKELNIKHQDECIQQSVGDRVGKSGSGSDLIVIYG